jgi:dipeptidyl aminopeptidase/acylaminoacyl peptidase
MIFSRWAMTAVLATAALGAPADPPRPMTLVDLAELPRVLDPQLASNGRFVTYLLSHADWKADRPVWNLWRQNIDGGAPEPLTAGAPGDIPGSTRISPDARTVLFARAGQLYLIPATGGAPRQLTHHSTGVSSPAWTPDGAAVYFLASDPATDAERERDRLKDDVYAVDRNFRQRHLWKATVATGTEERITSGDFTVLTYHLSRDGRRIAFERAPSPLVADLPQAEVWVMDASGDHARRLTDNNVSEEEPELSPDNSRVLFLAGANERFEPYYDENLFIAPSGGGRPTAVFPDGRYSFERATWAPDGHAIIAVVNQGVRNAMFRIDPDARTATPLTDGESAVPPWPAPAFSLEPSAREIVFLLDEPSSFGDAWLLPVDGGTPARVTRVFEDLDRRFALPRQERVTWKSADGTTVEGLLFYPIDYHPGQRYPLVVQLHGGPQEADRYGAGPGLLINYFPVLAARGYAVLRPNYRGSIGYGNAFMRGVVGGYFRHQPADVLAGVDALIRKGIVDPDRLILMGWSAGGTLANKLITMTGRFKAASSGAGVANWTSLYAQTDTRASRALIFGGAPWEPTSAAAYWNQSPLRGAANVTTPTLFFAGEADSRVPKEQALEMYRALDARHVPTRLYVAPREGHQWGELRHQLFKANAELEWFERYALGRQYTWEQPPSDR